MLRTLVVMAWLIATAILAWQAARVTWLIVPTGSNAEPTKLEARDTMAADGRGDSRASDPDIDAIVQRRLFGQPKAQAEDEPAAVEAAPETRLDLKLHGVYASSVEQNSIAIIKPRDQDRKLYRVGDTVAGQAQISAIQREQVVLKRAGRREVLPLKTETVEAEPAGTQNVSKEQGKRLSRYRERIQDNPQQLRQLMNPSPVRDQQGNLQGYRLAPGQSSNLFDITDLESGDVITAIGNTKLDSNQAAMKAMQELGDRGSVELTVERNGSRRRVRLNFEN